MNLLIKNEQRLLAVANNKTNQIKLEDKRDYTIENFMYVSGKGSIQLINTYKVIGRRLFYLTSSELAKQSYFTLTNEGNTLLATAQLSVISNKDFEQVKLINHTKTTTFVFYNNPFFTLLWLEIN